MKDILLIYGHALSRYEVNALINADRNLRLAEQFSTVNAAISSTRKRRFDVVVIDVSGPEKNGLEIFCDFKQACPSLPVLVINGSQHIRRMLNYLRLGCKGYLPYTSRSEEVIPAIRCLARGKQYALKRLRKIAAQSQPLPHERLSMRELQILFKLIKGQAVSAVAKELSIAPSSVSVFRSKILKKMHVSNNAALIHYAIDHQLVPPQAH